MSRTQRAKNVGRLAARTCCGLQGDAWDQQYFDQRDLIWAGMTLRMHKEWLQRFRSEQALLALNDAGGRERILRRSKSKFKPQLCE